MPGGDKCCEKKIKHGNNIDWGAIYLGQSW